MYDIERVEILKGPQGTLFGRNATGGLVHYITKKPTREAEAFLDFTGGEYDLIRVEGALSGPLSDTISGRIAGLYRSHDEILDNVFPFGDEPAASRYPFGVTGSGTRSGEDTWNDDTSAFRAHLMFEPNDKISFLISGNFAEVEKSEGPYQSVGVTAVVDSEARVVETVFTPATGPESRCEVIAVEGGCVLPGEVTSTGNPRLITTGVDGELEPFPTLDIGNIAFGLPPATPEDGLRPVAGGDLFGYIDPDGGDFLTSKDFAETNINKFETYGVTATLTWDIRDDLTLTSVTDWKENERYVVLDVDSAPAPQTLFQTDSTIEQFSQELRVNGAWDWGQGVLGFYYLNIDSEMINGLALPINSPLIGLDTVKETAPGSGICIIPTTGAVDPTCGALATVETSFVNVRVPFLGAEANNFVNLETKSYSLFGQMDYELTEKLTLIFGLRGIFEDKDYDRESRVIVNTDDTLVERFTGSNFVAGAGYDMEGSLRLPFSDSDDRFLWTGKLQLDYSPNDNWLLYAGVNRGTKAWGYNAKLADGTPALTDEQMVYDEEVLVSYEVGFKSTLFDGSTTLNGAFYYYDYTDYQAFLFFQSSGVVSNVDGNYAGFEIDLTSNPIANLDLMVGISYIDAELENLAVAPGVLRDVEPSFTPDFQAIGLIRYTWPGLIAGGDTSLQFKVSHQSEYFHNIRNFQAHEIEDRTVFGARAGWVSREGKWQLDVFVENLSDERDRLISFDLAGLCGCQEEAYIDPSWWGASIRWNFL